MKLTRLALAATLAAAGSGFAASASAQANEQFFPLLSYRTGAYAPTGIPWARVAASARRVSFMVYLLG